MTHICVGKLTTIGSDNGLSPGRGQFIIGTIAGVVLIGPLGTNFSENLIGIQTFSFNKMPLKMSSAKWRPSCLGLSMLKITFIVGTFPTNAIWQTVLKSSHVQRSAIERWYFICTITVAKPLTKMDTKFPSSYHCVTKISDIIMKCYNISF